MRVCRIGVAKLSCNHRVASVCEEEKNLANEGQVSKTTVQCINIAFSVQCWKYCSFGPFINCTITDSGYKKCYSLVNLTA